MSKFLLRSLALFSLAGSAALTQAQVLYAPGTLQNVTNGSSNVGIGTTSPGAKLDVNGSLSVETGGLYLLPTAGTENGLVLFGSGQYAAINMAGGVRTVKLVAPSVAGAVGVYLGAQVTTTDSTSSEVNRVWNRVNTDYPAWLMEMGDSVSSGGFAVKRASAGTNPITWTTLFDVLPNGNVGIGTVAPAAHLDVRGPNAQNTLTVDANTSEDIRVLSANNRSYDGGIITIGGSWGPTAYIKSAALNGSAGSLVLGTRRNPTDTIMQPSMVLDNNGNVGIGTTNPTYPLSVNGTVRAKEVIVDTGWSDYVFKPEYHLASLHEVAGSIEKEGHLPGIPSAQEVAEHGISVGDMQAKLLAKVEELTLYVIDQEKRQERLSQTVEQLQKENAALRTALTALQKP